MITCYVLFPIWKLVDNFLLSIVFAVFVGVAVPLLVSWLVRLILQEFQPKISLGALAMKHKMGLYYFVITSVVYLLILGLLVVAPLLPRGGEPFHVYRLLTMSWILTIGGRIDPLLIGFFVIMGVFIGLLFILLFSSETVEVSLLRRISAFVSTRIGKLLIWGIIAVGCAGFALIFSIWTIETNSLSRFGPLNPVLLFLPHLLFGYSDLTIVVWRILNLMIMVGAATICGKITHDLISEIDKDNHLGSKIRHALSAFAGWLFLFYPITITHSTQLYLAAGVSLFFMLNCYFLIKLLRSHDQSSEILYILLLSLGLGFGSLWKRVILVQAGVCFLIILIVFFLRSGSLKSDKLQLWFKALLVYCLLFGPWLIVIQFQGIVGRPYIPEITNWLPPYIFDYLFRFENHMGLILGALGYVSLFAILIIALFRRSWILFTLSAQYGVWYLFFTLDAGWEHTADRFFVPGLALLAISTILLLASTLTIALPVFQKMEQSLRKPQEHESKVVIQPSKKAYVSAILVGIILLSTFAGATQNFVATSVFIDDTLDNQFLPYDEAAQFIHSVVNGNSSKIWSNWGPSSLSFYMNKYGDYSITPSGYGATWQPDPLNDTVEAFVDFLNVSGYSVLALPHQEMVSPGYCPPLIVEELLLHYDDLGFTDMVDYTFGSNHFYIWTL